MAAVYPVTQPVGMPMPMTVVLPVPVQWAPPQGARANCPPGLEQLCDLPTIKIIEDINPAEVVISTHIPNRYSVRNPANQQIYFVTEQASVFSQSSRQIDLQVQDASTRVCMTLSRPPLTFNCCCGGGDGADVHSRMLVASGDGRNLGEVRMLAKCCENKMEIRDSSDNIMFYLTANLAAGSNFFAVDNGNGVSLGSVSRVLGDAVQQIYDAQNYQVAFPPDAHPTAKGLLFAAAILVDYTFFENSRRSSHSHSHSHSHHNSSHAGYHHGHHGHAGHHGGRH